MYELHAQHAICKRSALGPAAVLAIRQKSGETYAAVQSSGMEAIHRPMHRHDRPAYCCQIRLLKKLLKYPLFEK